jgi:hypothetical protein
MAKMRDALKLTKDPIERMYLSYELSCCCSLVKQREHMRTYARQCMYIAKRVGNVVWFLNSLFLLVRAELSDGNLTDARVTLAAIVINCKKYAIYPPLFFALRVSN